MFRATAIVLALFLPTAAAAGEIAVTFDDLPAVTTSGGSPDAITAEQRQITDRLLQALREARVPAIGFVNGDKLLDGDRIDRERLALLDAWIEAGMELANHTFSHPDLSEVGVDAFLTDVQKGDEAVRRVLAPHHQVPRWFRHPFLHTGRSAADRAAVEAGLRRLGLRVAPVTIDNSDWIFNRAFRNAANDPALAARIADEYIEYMTKKAEYYDCESERLFGRRIPQVLLLHASALNAATFGRLAAALRAAGHTFVPLAAAVDDLAYATADRYFGPAGISWLDRWALTRGVPKGFFAAEPRTPRWILECAGVDSE